MSSLIVSVCVHKREKEIERERKGEREMQKQQVACSRPQQHLAFTHPGVVTCVCVCVHMFLCVGPTLNTLQTLIFANETCGERAICMHS